MEIISVQDMERLEIYDLFDTELYDKILGSKDCGRQNMILNRKSILILTLEQMHLLEL